MPNPEKSTISFEPKNEEELAQFFKAHKDSYHEIWIILTKKTYANPQPVSFNQAVSEAVKLGLIDRRTKTLSEQKYAIRFKKEKPNNSIIPALNPAEAVDKALELAKD